MKNTLTRGAQIRRARRPVSGPVAASVAVLTTSVALGGCAAVGSPPASPATNCPGLTAADYAAAPVLRRLRVYTDPKTGDSAIAETPMPAKRTPLFKTGQILLEYNFGKSSKVQIVVGPPNLDIAMKPTPYRESFLVLEGSFTMKLGDGSVHELRPGDMTDFEDTDARIGHGGRTGPCGYVSLNIVP